MSISSASIVLLRQTSSADIPFDGYVRFAECFTVTVYKQ